MVRDIAEEGSNPPPLRVFNDNHMVIIRRNETIMESVVAAANIAKITLCLFSLRDVCGIKTLAACVREEDISCNIFSHIIFFSL